MTCKRCGSQTTRIRTGPGSWSYDELCPTCRTVTRVNCGDAMGGSFDQEFLMSEDAAEETWPYLTQVQG